METIIVTYFIDLFDDLELTVNVTSSASKSVTDFHMEWEIMSIYVLKQKHQR